MSEQDTTPPEAGFDPHRLRTITDMERSRDDRILGGVCAGAAKYLNIDPVVVRVVIAVLTFVGFAGVIIYLAAWFLLPAEGEAKSVAADWFRLDKNEEQIRIAGLVGAVVLAAVSIVGEHGYGWWGFPWFLFPIAAVYYLFVVRPRRWRGGPDEPGHETPADTTANTSAANELGAQITADVTAKVNRKVADKIARAREPKSKALVLLTLSVIAIGVAITRIYADFHDGAPWTTYVAVALAITAAGLLVGTFYGYGGPLIALGIVLGVALAFGSALPNARMGDQTVSPMTAAQVDNTYKHGVGLLKLDLSQVAEPDQLLGRTITLREGIGQTKVIVPAGINVKIDSHLTAGEIAVFDRKVNGTDNELDYPADQPGQPTLVIKIHQRLGNVEVIRS